MFFLSYMFVDTALLRAWLFLWMLLRALLLYSKKVRQGGNGLSKKYEANHCGGSIALLIKMFHMCPYRTVEWPKDTTCIVDVRKVAC
jgi:hypothetical protein